MHRGSVTIIAGRTENRLTQQINPAIGLFFALVRIIRRQWIAEIESTMVDKLLEVIPFKIDGAGDASPYRLPVSFIYRLSITSPFVGQEIGQMKLWSGTSANFIGGGMVIADQVNVNRLFEVFAKCLIGCDKLSQTVDTVSTAAFEVGVFENTRPLFPGD